MGEPIRTRFTFADYLTLPEDGQRYEVFEGEVMMSPAPGYRHQQVVTNLLFTMETWRRSHDAKGRVLTAPFDVVLADTTIVQPDLIYVRGERASLIVEERLHGIPDVAVEIFHQRGAARDRVAKLHLYVRFQIPEYWLIDLDARSITMLALADTTYASFAEGAGDSPLESRVMPGFTIRPVDAFEGT